MRCVLCLRAVRNVPIVIPRQHEPWGLWKGIEMAFVILNTNKIVWGSEAFASEAIAEAELRNFYKKDLKRDRFSIVPTDARHAHLPVLDAITGDYAGMLADAINRKYPGPKAAAKVEAA